MFAQVQVQQADAVAKGVGLGRKPAMVVVVVVVVAAHLTVNVGSGRLGVHEKRDNEAIKTQNFGKNEDKNHANKEFGLLGGAANAGVSNNSNGETYCVSESVATSHGERMWVHTSGQASQADGETSTQLDEASVEGKLLLESRGHEHRHDQAVNGNDTSHNDGNNVWPVRISGCNALKDSRAAYS